MEKTLLYNVKCTSFERTEGTGFNSFLGFVVDTMQTMQDNKGILKFTLLILCNETDNNHTHSHAVCCFTFKV